MKLTRNANDTDNRMVDRINEANQIKAVMEAESQRMSSEIGALHQQVTQKDRDLRDTIEVVQLEVDVAVERKIGELKQKFIDQFGQVEIDNESMRADATASIAKLTESLQTWSLKLESGYVGPPPGIDGTGTSGKGHPKGGSDKRDLAVWKLEDGVDKLKFRHWVEAVENHLEHMHGWDRSSEILDRVR